MGNILQGFSLFGSIGTDDSGNIVRSSSVKMVFDDKTAVKVNFQGKLIPEIPAIRPRIILKYQHYTSLSVQIGETEAELDAGINVTVHLVTEATPYIDGNDLEKQVKKLCKGTPVNPKNVLLAINACIAPEYG